MSAILFTVAAVTLVWLLIVSPGVIRQHRADVLMKRWAAVMPRIEFAFAQLGEHMKAIGYAADVAAKRWSEAFADALDPDKLSSATWEESK